MGAPVLGDPGPEAACGQWVKQGETFLEGDIVRFAQGDFRKSLRQRSCPPESCNRRFRYVMVSKGKIRTVHQTQILELL